MAFQISIELRPRSMPPTYCQCMFFLFIVRQIGLLADWYDPFSDRIGPDYRCKGRQGKVQPYLSLSTKWGMSCPTCFIGRSACMTVCVQARKAKKRIGPRLNKAILCTLENGVVYEVAFHITTDLCCPGTTGIFPSSMWDLWQWHFSLHVSWGTSWVRNDGGPRGSRTFNTHNLFVSQVHTPQYSCHHNSTTIHRPQNTQWCM